MKLTVMNRDGLKIHYDTDQILRIEHCKALDRYNKSDLEGNGLNADDSILIIFFKKGEIASFGSDWVVTF